MYPAIRNQKPVFSVALAISFILFLPFFLMGAPLITEVEGTTVTEGVEINLTVSEINFSGTSTPGTSVEIRHNGRKAAQTITAGDGQWSVSAGSFLTGSYSFCAVVEDWPQTPEESFPVTVNVDLSGNPVPPAAYSFEINYNSSNATSERTTTSALVYLTLFTSDPAGIASVKISNDNIFWETFNNPQTAPASMTWLLENTEGNKTVYAKFYDADLNESNTISREIVYFSGVLISSGTADSGVYPSSAYDEYPGENRYGKKRSSPTQPDTGSSLLLTVP